MMRHMLLSEEDETLLFEDKVLRYLCESHIRNES